ncbi:MAG: peptidoglycan DD-metalloendopeptidase family protein [Candidatus Polarisedimenticolaceae bacterium]|nr:peptidoglycan DD-metalloendopeptidase family protein [Candidatus Polarisedimenticolaceae bacterium]
MSLVTALGQFSAMFLTIPRFFSALIVLFVLFPASHSQADDNQHKAKIEKLKQLQGEILRVEKSLSDAQSQKKSVNSILRDTERSIGESAKRLRALEGLLSRQRQQLAELEKNRQRAEKNLGRHRMVLEKQIRAAYAMGRQERLKILLNQQDPVKLSRVMTYYDYLNAERTQQMSEITEMLNQLESLEKKISTEEARLLALKEGEEAERLVLESAREAREKAVLALNDAIKDKSQQMRYLKQDEQRLQQVLADLQRTLADLSQEVFEDRPFKKMRGKLPWPAKGRITASFGSSKQVGNLRWDGLLIAAPEGREIRSIHHGRIAFADWLRGFGLLIIIDHGEGYMSLYGHNQSLFKETGEWVEPGEVVALVGNSGGRRNPSLYFGIRYNGKAVNPRRWCKKQKGSRVGATVKNPLWRPFRALLDLG